MILMDSLRMSGIIYYLIKSLPFLYLMHRHSIILFIIDIVDASALSTKTSMNLLVVLLGRYILVVQNNGSEIG